MRIAIVGGGITGLVLAERLLSQKHHVEIYEEHDLGGLAAGFSISGGNSNYLEKYYHHFFTTDTSLIRLIEEHGLYSDVIWKPTRSGIFAENRHWVLCSSLDLMKCAPIGSLLQRFVMGINMLYLKRLKDWVYLDQISCKEFFQRRMNSEAYHNFWERMLKAKFDLFHDVVPMAFLWGRIHPRSSSRRNGYEVLGYLRGGFQRLINSINMRILDLGGSVREHCSISKINVGMEPELFYEGGSAVFDKVIWTAPTDILRRVVGEEESKSKSNRELEDPKYMNVTCLVLIMNKKLGEIYWLNNIDPSVSFGIAIEHTNLVSAEDYGMKHVIYLANYHSPESLLNQLSDIEVLNYHSPSLKKVFPTFSEGDICQYKVFRSSYSCPIYDLQYSTKIPPYQGRYPKIDICCMAQVYPEDRNMNNCIRKAETYLASVAM